MKSMTVTLGAALLVLMAGTANAGSDWIGFSGGAGIPTGDYGNAANTGWQLGATGTHMLNSQWGIGADVAYHAWSGSNDLNAAAETLFGPGSEYKWSAVQATAHATMAFPTQGNAKPYMQAGLGLYELSLKLSSPSGDNNTSKSKFGFNLGGGMDFLTSHNMRWGIAANYHIVPAQNDLGSDLNFFTLGANVVWGVGH